MIDSQLKTLFSYDGFRRLAENEPISQYQFNIMTNSLIDRDIPFDVSYVSGSRKAASAATSPPTAIKPSPASTKPVL